MQSAVERGKLGLSKVTLTFSKLFVHLSDLVVQKDSNKFLLHAASILQTFASAISEQALAVAIALHDVIRLLESLVKNQSQNSEE